MRRLTTFGLALTLTACSGGTSYLKDARSLASSTSPEVDSLLAKNQSLGERAAKLAPDRSAELGQRLSANRTELQSIKGDIDGAPGQIESAEQGKKLEAAKQAYEAEQAASKNRLPAARTELAAIEAAIAQAEKPSTAVRAAARFSKTLSTGYHVLGNMNGIEAQLLAFIEDGGKVVDKTTWFDFDRLTFKTAAADLDMDQSKEQLENIAQIMKAFPAVSLKVGGYTDNVGKPAANMKLSGERAKNVAKNLSDLGVVATRLAPEGYGPNNPVCPANDTEECRQKNRRISVRVTAK